MEIISPQHTSKVFYDKFAIGYLQLDRDLILIDEFYKKFHMSLILQEYELSKELIIWISSDLFAEFQFDDTWLIFPKSEKSRVENVFAELKSRLPKLFQQPTPNLFRRDFYRMLNELKEETNLKNLPVAA